MNDRSRRLRKGRWGSTLVACVGLAIAWPWAVGEVRAVEPSDAEPVQTIERVWFRDQGIRGVAGWFNKAGDLSITETALRVTTRKREYTIPIEAIRAVSYGGLKRNADTEWVVFEVGKGEKSRLVGIRDGSRMGYGQRTDEIFRDVKKALKRFGVAQYDVAPDQRVYEPLEHHVTFAIPRDWSARPETMTFDGEGTPWGRVVFSRALLRPSGSDRGTIAPVVIERVQRGEVVAFFVEVEPRGPRMSCRRIGRSVRKTLLARAAEDPILGDGFEVLEPPDATPWSIDGCEGVRIRARSRDESGRTIVLDLRAVTHEETLLWFGIRASESELDAVREPFERMLESVRFSVAR